jgi:hypothetical protein
MKMKYVMLTALACSVCGVYSESFVKRVSVETVSSEYPQRLAQYIVNGYGLNRLTLAHETGLSGKLWQSAGNGNQPLTTPVITFNLGRTCSLDAIRVWNYNNSNSGRGLKEVDVFVSPDKNPDNLVFVETVVFPQAPATPDYTGDLIKLSENELYQNARMVRFVTKSNHGDQYSSGLSEVRFIEKPEQK